MADFEWEAFETLPAECKLIAMLVTDGTKPELYLRFALHYRELVADTHGSRHERRDVARSNLRASDFH